MIFEIWLQNILYNFNLSNLFSPFLKDIYLFFALFGLLFFEIALVGWKKCSLTLCINSGRSGIWDLFSVLAYASGFRKILSSIFTLGLIGIVYFLSDKLKTIIGIKIDWPLWIKYLLIALAYDFLFYWSHRIKHESSWLWNLHEFHHSAKVVNLFTTYRSHPMDSLLYQITIALPIYIFFELSLIESVYFIFISGIFGLINHARLDTNFGLIGKYILVSPLVHHHHHSIERSDSNYGEIFIFWDKIFGTYVEPPKSIHDIRQGIHNNFYETDSYYMCLLRPAIKFYRRLFSVLNFFN